MVSLIVAYAVLAFTWFNKPLIKNEEKRDFVNLVLTAGVMGAMIMQVIDVLVYILTK